METTFIYLKQTIKTSLLTLGLMLASVAQAQLIYGTNGTSLVSFNAAAPGTILGNVAISGITIGQTIEGMDFRPNTGQLYAFGYDKILGTYQIYTINITTGAATPVNAIAASIALGTGPIGFDFNPTVDRIRVVSANGANFRLHPVTGVIAATDLNLTYAVGDANAATTPMVTAVAYTNSYIGAATTTLYDFDKAINNLTTQNPPNNGVLNTIGATGGATNAANPLTDMDIFFDPLTSVNTAYFVSNASADASADTLYTINLMTGVISTVGAIGNASAISNIAVFIDRTIPALVGELAYGLTGNNNLISFDTQSPSFIRSIAAVSGLTAGQSVVGMDFRPATGMLYALAYDAVTNDAQLYTINTTSGTATAVSATAVSLALGGNVNIGMDFNPVADKIRVVSNNTANYRLDPVTAGITATDINVAYGSGDVNFGATPNVGNVAYINSYAGTTTTALYNFDENLNVFTLQTPPNNGVLSTIGVSGLVLNSADKTIDFDIYYNSLTSSNSAYIAANINNETIDRLYSIDLATGATTAIGKIGYGVPVKDIAIVPDATVGLSNAGNLNKKQIKLYPNPASDQLSISLADKKLVSIIITDLLGRKVQEHRSDSSTTIVLDMKDLNKGIYLITVSDDEEFSVTERFIIH